MSDPTRPEWSDPTQSAGTGYPPNPDPAYSGQYPGYWGPTYYGPGYSGPMTQPTQQFPSYWQPGSGYPPPAPPPPPPPKSPRWLWIAAGAAALLVTGLVLALVIVSGSSRDSTVVAPATQTTATSSPRLSPPANPTTRPTPTTPRVPITTTTRLPMPSATEEPAPSPGETTGAPRGTETVVYSVTGEGRAINITYVDTDGVMQTEFNVALPWSKEVSLSAPAKGSASVAVVNVGRDVTCSVSVNGAQIRQRTGRGLTICTGAA